MNREPILVIMAAGMGSRYGGMKQIDPVGKNGEIIIDYSLYDAMQAGFRRVIFIIQKKNEEDFRQMVGDRISGKMEVQYAFQELEDLPQGYSVPEGRQKPWGTGQAVLACRKLIDAPFAVINADDFYGREGFAKIYRFLKELPQGEENRFAMVGYTLKNTLTDNGYVSRGVCSLRGSSLQGITERTRIEKAPEGGARFSEDDGETWTSLDPESVVSMNLWGFPASMIGEMEQRFAAFLEKTLQENPLKGEYYLPSVVNQLLEEGKVQVEVLRSHDKWYGVTYREDKPVVQAALARMAEEGVYPSPLFR